MTADDQGADALPHIASLRLVFCLFDLPWLVVYRYNVARDSYELLTPATNAPHFSPPWHTIHPQDSALLQAMRSQQARFSSDGVAAGSAHPDVQVQLRLVDDANCWHEIVVREVVLDRDARGQPELVLGLATRQTDQLTSEGDWPSLVRCLLDLHERERQVTAFDMHDGFVQEVVGAHMALESFITRTEWSDPAERVTLQRACDLLSHAIAQARRLIGGLRAAPVEDRPLDKALGRFLEEQQADGGLEITLACSLAETRLPSVLETTVFRIVQEAIRNVRQHSGCRQAHVRIVQENATISIEVLDDGSGFDVDAVPAGRFGLEGMRQRARFLGGETSLESQPGAGTRVTVRLPIRND